MPPKGAGKGKQVEVSRALDERADVDIRRVLENLSKVEHSIEPLMGFMKKLKIELQSIRDGLQTDFPSSTLLVVSPLSRLQLSAALGALASYPWLKSIQLHHCFLGDDGVRVLCDFIDHYKPAAGKNSSGIDTLELPGCCITASGAALLGSTMARNNTIRALCLDFNPLKDEGVTVLAEGIKWNSTIQLLSLQYCGIMGAGGEAIGTHIISCANLVGLSLRGNHMGWRGISVVAQALPLRCTLVALDVANTGIGSSDTTVEALCLGIAGSRSLQSVDLDLNVLRPDALRHVIGMARVHPTLIDVRVHERANEALFTELMDVLDAKRRVLVGGKKKTKK